MFCYISEASTCAAHNEVVLCKNSYKEIFQTYKYCEKTQEDHFLLVWGSRFKNFFNIYLFADLIILTIQIYEIRESSLLSADESKAEIRPLGHNGCLQRVSLPLMNNRRSISVYNYTFAFFFLFSLLARKILFKHRTEKDFWGTRNISDSKIKEIIDRNGRKTRGCCGWAQ